MPHLLCHSDVDATLTALTALTALRPASPTAERIARLDDAIVYVRSQRGRLSGE